MRQRQYGPAHVYAAWRRPRRIHPCHPASGLRVTFHSAAAPGTAGTAAGPF
ncbi:hypothetical protein OG828_48085 [Streptomyces sp. NBC_00457]|uniref:hypothetical protein n=1 Tax=Streptomyces sp. NBC_00457 TaxID=2975748 RepID=UPI002E1F03C4